MNKYFRYLVLTKSAAVYDSVKTSLEQKGYKEENKPTYSGSITIPGVEGASVKCPDNPIINGKYNVFFQMMSGKNPTKSGVNTIIVEVNTQIFGSGEYAKRYGNSTWINKQLGMIQVALSKKFGSVSLGKLSLGSFSAGYGAVGGILSDPAMRDRVDSVVILDGIHHGQNGKPNRAAMKPWEEYAKMAKNDPNKRFVFLYTAVDPGAYASTSDSANYLNAATGAQQQPQDPNKTYAGITPSSISNIGGYTAIQLYPRKSDKPGYGYLESEQRKQHVMAANALPDVWGDYLSDYNS
ncbi:MAG: hypothetical protein ACOYO1_05150 [Bacteroidales bacterium]